MLEWLSRGHRESGEDSNPDHWDLKRWSLPHFTLPGGCQVLLEPFCNGGCWRIPSSLRQCSLLNSSECQTVSSTHCSWQDVLEPW